MEDKLTEIEKICGLKPDNIQFKIIENDPNFIFEPNPSFEKITLYYPDNNPINVSSWLECSNYVYGGWTDIQTSLINWEQNVSVIYFLFIIVVLSKEKLIKFYERLNEKFK